MKTSKELHASYTGKMGKIGFNQYTKEDASKIVKRHMSQQLLKKLIEYSKETGTIFNMYTYSTKDDGQLEIIQDFEGNYYGIEHGLHIEKAFFGFN